MKRGPLPPECPISAARNGGISLYDWPGPRQGVIGMGRAVPTVAYGLDRRPMEHVKAGDVGVPADRVGSFVGPDRQRFPNSQFRLLTGCKARHVYAYNFPWSCTPLRPTVEARRQRGRKKYHKICTLLFLHTRQSSKMQSTHRNGAHRLKACELVLLSIVGRLALGAFVSVSGGPEHASTTEVLMSEIHF